MLLTVLLSLAISSGAYTHMFPFIKMDFSCKPPLLYQQGLSVANGSVYLFLDMYSYLPVSTDRSEVLAILKSP